MASRCLSRLLIIALGFVWCAPTQAQKKPEIFAPGSSIGLSKGQADAIVIGVVAVGVAAVVVTVVLIKRSQSKTVTGCVSNSPNGLILTDAKDKQIYTLFGDTSTAKPGDEITLRGKKIKPTAVNPHALAITKMKKDFGACQP